MGAATGRPLRTDDATTLNVRLVLKTKDEALIGMTYSAIRHGPPDVVAKIEKGEVVDPTSYYFRIRQRPSAGGRADFTASSKSSEWRHTHRPWCELLLNRTDQPRAVRAQARMCLRPETWRGSSCGLD
jgi:hypothetical protein